jgi:formylglycine-generating enzyme
MSGLKVGVKGGPSGPALNPRPVHFNLSVVRFFFAVLLVACGDVNVRPNGDAQIAVEMDASSDAGMDARVIASDSGPIDGGTPCIANGVMGYCQYVSQCTGVSTRGLCPGPTDFQCCTPRVDAGGGGSCDPSIMPTPNDGLVEEYADIECPLAMVLVSDICIDRYEASLVLTSDAGPIGSWSPFHNPGGNRVAAVSLRDAIPQAYISGVQAGRACAEAGKRLCTNTEWLRACRGPSNFVYPYGNTRDEGVCNDHRAMHPAVEYFGTSADWIWSELDNACIDQLPASLARTGSHPGCITAEGALDMMGNLHEWTSDSAGTFRGGFYVDTVINGEGCLYATTAHDMGHWDYSTGFRCCADPL